MGLLKSTGIYMLIFMHRAASQNLYQSFLNIDENAYSRIFTELDSKRKFFVSYNLELEKLKCDVRAECRLWAKNIKKMVDAGISPNERDVDDITNVDQEMLSVLRKERVLNEKFLGITKNIMGFFGSKLEPFLFTTFCRRIYEPDHFTKLTDLEDKINEYKPSYYKRYLRNQLRDSNDAYRYIFENLWEVLNDIHEARQAAGHLFVDRVFVSKIEALSKIILDEGDGDASTNEYYQDARIALVKTEQAFIVYNDRFYSNMTIYYNALLSIIQSIWKLRDAFKKDVLSDDEIKRACMGLRPKFDGAVSFFNEDDAYNVLSLSRKVIYLIERQREMLKGQRQYEASQSAKGIEQSSQPESAAKPGENIAAKEELTKTQPITDAARRARRDRDRKREMEREKRKLSPRAS